MSGSKHDIAISKIKQAINFEKSIINNDLNVKNVEDIDGYSDMCTRAYNISAMIVTLKVLEELKVLL